MTNHLTVMVGTHGAHHNRRCIWHSAAVHECNKQTVQGKPLEAVLGTKITSTYPSLCYKKVASRLLHCTIDHIVHAEVFRTFLYLVSSFSFLFTWMEPHMSIALKYVDQLAVSSFFFFRDYWKLFLLKFGK